MFPPSLTAVTVALNIGWWLVAGGWWLVAGGWRLAVPICLRQSAAGGWLARRSAPREGGRPAAHRRRPRSHTANSQLKTQYFVIYSKLVIYPALPRR
jgi:hypothetical protein